ncbi:Uncharacterized protein FWK35_00015717 [Aphis craccivora]|uniref:Reverse transcriptase domain-containing protein n=1 Tax=Aphis craccivora TaxID=307492 RepID=A0A6G0YMJ6_APHCR|nr:Uncharacterized protein FWK35_00015717 [Aphis craccivora]
MIVNKWHRAAFSLISLILALTYSAAEYGAQVWCNSAHVKKIDTQLHSVMRVISGTVKSTLLQWLPVLINIAPPDLRRKQKLNNNIKKAGDRRNSLLVEKLEDIPTLRLKSRKPLWKTAKDLIRSGFETKKRWFDEWTNPTISIKNKNLVLDPNQGVVGMGLPRHEWSVLNRLRTGHGRCADMMFKWRLQGSSACNCSNDRQTINHILKECQLRKFHQGIKGIHVITP